MTFTMRTAPEISLLLEPIDKIITEVFIKNVFNRECSAQERKLFALPVRLGGMGIVEVSRICDIHYSNSVKATLPLLLLYTSPIYTNTTWTPGLHSSGARLIVHNFFSIPIFPSPPSFLSTPLPYGFHPFLDHKHFCIITRRLWNILLLVFSFFHSSLSSFLSLMLFIFILIHFYIIFLSLLSCHP